MKINIYQKLHKAACEAGMPFPINLTIAVTSTNRSVVNNIHRIPRKALEFIKCLTSTYIWH